MKHRLLFALMLSVQASSAWSADEVTKTTASVYQTTLENGLQIVVKEDHRAPVLTSQIWYKIGASDEPDGITGISHMLEHMMFKGTQNLAPGEFSKRVAKVGATENAFTSQDYTAYFQTVEKSHLRTMLSLEAERMGSLKLKDEELQKERQVVLEERRMRTEDNPNARLYERFNALAYDASPYRRPVIGWQSDIEGYQLSELQNWYDRWYAPNNATLVVVGDVTPEQVKQVAQETIGKVPARAHDAKPKLPQVIPVGEKRLIMHDERTKVPMLMMGYAVPSLLTAEDKADGYALAVLAEILDGGDSARLSREWVRGQQKLSSASADYDLYARLSTQFTLSAVPADGVSLEEAEKALQASIAKVIAQGISKEELARVQAGIEANRVFEADSTFYQAMKLGESATIGLELAELEAYPERIRAVTADQVISAAKRWLVSDRLSVAYLLPKAAVVAHP